MIQVSKDSTFFVFKKKIQKQYAIVNYNRAFVLKGHVYCYVELQLCHLRR